MALVIKADQSRNPVVFGGTRGKTREDWGRGRGNACEIYFKKLMTVYQIGMPESGIPSDWPNSSTSLRGLFTQTRNAIWRHCANQIHG